MIEKQLIIGKTTEVIYNKKKFNGTIIDETKNMVLLESGGRTIRIIKKNAKFIIENKKINGKDISRRPEDRIK